MDREALTLNLVKNRTAQIYRKRSVAGDKGRGGLSHKRLPCQRTLSSPSETVLKNVPFPRSSRTCNYRRPKSGEIKRGDDVPMLEIIGVDDLFSYPSPKEIKGELVDSSLIEVLNSIVI